MRKIGLFVVCILLAAITKAQLSGSFESNSAWYIDDDKIKLESTDAENRIRSNNYLRLQYRKKHYTVGIQAEAYSPKALLNYALVLKDAGLGSYFLNYKNDSIGLDITAGHFQEQFGSGLALRTWEDRQLGIANSIMGGRIKYSPIKSIHLTALAGKQRNGLGFDFTNGVIIGANAEFELSNIFKAKKIDYGIGLSFVNRNTKDNNPLLESNNYITSVRGNIKIGGFTADAEYAFKSKDALFEFGSLRPELGFDGDAYLLNLGYTQSGFGFNANLRRLENFNFYSQRDLYGNTFNQGIVNYIPALTKQFDYSLTNIYVYAAQPGISFEPNRNKAGEIGGQFDVYYTFKKKSPLGGKYGTHIALNYSQWHGLAGKYIDAQRKYKAEKIGFGEKYYRDISLELRKKLTEKWMFILTYQNQFYNALYVEEAAGQVNANTVVIDNTLRFKKSISLKVQLQHQWADARFKNWAAAQVEYFFSSKVSVFAVDLYNYGNSNTNDRLHFYNLGGTYKKGPFRIQASYGRQRGGLICVGGVCRFVPQSAGLTMGINYSF